MMDIGFSELILVFILALVVLGPERLPRVLRTLSQWIRQIKTTVNSVQQEFGEELKQLDCTKELRELHHELQQPATFVEGTENSILPPPQKVAMPLEESNNQSKSSPDKDAL